MNQVQVNALRMNNAKIAIRKGILAIEAGEYLADPDDLQMMISIVDDYLHMALNELEGKGKADEKDGDPDEVE